MRGPHKNRFPIFLYFIHTEPERVLRGPVCESHAEVLSLRTNVLRVLRGSLHNWPREVLQQHRRHLIFRLFHIYYTMVSLP